MNADQRLAALEHANEIRARMAAIKLQLRSTTPKQASLELLADMLLHSDSDALGAMRVDQALRACHHVGQFQSQAILWAVEVNGRVRIRDLNAARREQLAAAICERAAMSRAAA